MCRHTWFNGECYMCSLLDIKCPYTRPNITIECIEAYEEMKKDGGKAGKGNNLQRKI